MESTVFHVHKAMYVICGYMHICILYLFVRVCVCVLMSLPLLLSGFLSFHLTLSCAFAYNVVFAMQKFKKFFL